VPVFGKIALLRTYYGFSNFPASLFPDIPPSANRVASGESRYYEGNVSSYFASQENEHVARGDTRYVIPGDSDAYTYCGDVGSAMKCWEYDTSDGEYVLTIYEMDEGYFYSDFVHAYN
jgi:hypothetical protein